MAMDLGAATGMGSVSEQARVAAADGAISAELEPAPDKWSWVRRAWPWEATPGRHQLSVGVHDASGRSQPTEQPWHRGGLANNLVQHVTVVVPG